MYDPKLPGGARYSAPPVERYAALAAWTGATREFAAFAVHNSEINEIYDITVGRHADLMIGEIREALGIPETPAWMYRGERRMF